MDLSVRERMKYQSIEWMMPSVDVENFCKRIGIRIISRNGDEWTGYCPDHSHYTGREPSHPKWNLNVRTGQTYCFTEGRGSNLLWTACRLLHKSPDEVARIMLDANGEITLDDLEMRAVMAKARQILTGGENESESAETPSTRTFGDIEREMQSRPVSRRLYDFFMTPPGKRFPTGIKAETVDKYGVFERTWGYYADRAIIPYLMRGKLVAFAALDLLGAEEWRRRHPMIAPDEYRKVRYPAGVSLQETLFGFDNCERKCDNLFVLEGAREVMKLTQEGFPNAVAISGAYMGEKQWLLLTELSPRRIYLMFDGDEAGHSITERVESVVSRNYPRSRVIPCYPPLGRDPKTLDGGELRELVDFSTRLREKEENAR